MKEKVTLNRAERQLLLNLSTLRREILRGYFDQRRSLEDECGHPPISQTITIDRYELLYSRNPIAARVVELYPKESWQVQPTVYETEDINTVTPFEEAWRSLSNNIYGQQNYHRDEAGNSIWEILLRADILSGIGRYGVILLGLDDGKDLSTDARVTPGSTVQRKLTFLRPLPESMAQITGWDSDITSPRYGLPTEYTIQLVAPNDLRDGFAVPQSSMNVKVHWSRIVHIADNVTSNPVFGIPRMQTVLNRLLDLDKLYGSSAEMYYKGAFPGLAVTSNPLLGADVDIDEEETKDKIERYQNGLERLLLLIGMEAKPLPPQVVDPSPQIKTHIQAICIRIGSPMRIFMGSERGELASSQDDASWNDRLRDRERMHNTPKIIVPLVNTAISVGVLPVPKTGFSVAWPDLTSQTATEKSAVTFQLTQALSQYVSTGAWKLMSPQDYFVHVYGKTEEEAKMIFENAVKWVEENKDSILMMSGGQTPRPASVVDTGDQQLNAEDANRNGA